MPALVKRQPGCTGGGEQSGVQIIGVPLGGVAVGEYVSASELRLTYIQGEFLPRESGLNDDAHPSVRKTQINSELEGAQPTC